MFKATKYLQYIQILVRWARAGLLKLFCSAAPFQKVFCATLDG